MGQLLKILYLFRKYDIWRIPLQSPIGKELNLPFWYKALLRISKTAPKETAGDRLTKVLISLGPTYIKFGQILATRPDLVGEQVALSLSQLQDQLAPESFASIEKQIEENLGAAPEHLFASFEQESVSAASVAQVHFAKTFEGDEVAVKVLRPGIEKRFAKDMRFFLKLGRLFERSPRLKRYHVLDLVLLFKKEVASELDLRLEGAALQEMGEAFKNDSSYEVPAVYWAQTGAAVLTMSRVSGISLDEKDLILAQGHNVHDVMEKAATIFFHQIFTLGFFHGDQHAGNMMVGSRGQIVAVDFGIMGRMSYHQRCEVADLLAALFRRDYTALAQVFANLGRLPEDVNLAVFSQALRATCEPVLDKPLKDISFAKVFSQLLSMGRRFDLELYPDLFLLDKNMLMAEGISRQLTPDLNIWTLCQPLIENWMREHRSPQKRLKNKLEEGLEMLDRLPVLVHKGEAALSSLSRVGERKTRIRGRLSFLKALGLIAVGAALSALFFSL